MNQGTQGYSLTKKTEGRKSRDTVSLNQFYHSRFQLRTGIQTKMNLKLNLHQSILMLNAVRRKLARSFGNTIVKVA
jgi:hypothetical protein